MRERESLRARRGRALVIPSPVIHRCVLALTAWLISVGTASAGAQTPSGIRVIPEAAQVGTVLDQLEAEAAAAAAEEGEEAEREATRSATRQRLLEQARRAYDERLYLEAARAFRAADELESLEDAAADLYRDTRQQLLPIAQQIDLFRQREWDAVLPMLWRRLTEEPSNRDVRQMLTDSYFNIAVRDLRRGDPRGADESLREVIELEPNDALAGRLHEFAETYQQRQVDLLYRIFVAQLEFRQ